MLLIPQVQLPHINFDMRELTIGEAIGLVKLNPTAHEHTISQFLACVLTGNGRALTVQERYLLVAQYISATCVGEADFPIGDEAKYSDYLRMDKPLSLSPIALGFDENWQLSLLYGWQAEALEDLCHSWQDWIFGCMAAQLVKADDSELPTIETPVAAYQSWLKERITIFKAYPERDFAELYHAFLWGVERLNCYFELGFDNEGLVCLHKEGQGVAPARFQVSDCLTATAITFGR
jgi:hypothetical protein